MWITDNELRVIDGFGAKLGPAFNFDYFRGRTVEEIFTDHPDAMAPIEAHRGALGGRICSFEMSYGGYALEVTVEPHIDASGRIIGCVGQALDIGDRLIIEEALRESVERFEMVARAVNDAIWDWDIAAEKVWWSEGVKFIFGHEHRGRLTSPGWFLERVHPDDRERIFDSIHDAVDGESCTWMDEYRFQRADGSWAHVFDRGYIHRDKSGRAVRMVGGIQDITERKQLELDLYRRAFEDPLSGLPNRAHFIDSLERALTARGAQDTSLAVLFLDLDSFKSVNDSLGHPAGDVLLSDVGERLKGLLAAGTTSARLGGDEFAVLLEGLEFTSDAVDVANTLLAALREPWQVGTRTLNITASIGIASIERSAGEVDAAEVLRRADAAMYRAKEQGKDRYAFYEPALDERTLTHFEVELGLRSAIQTGQLRLYFQPEVDLATGRVEGMEALVRWQHPEQGLLAPADFIPIAEKTDLILAIDDWVFQEVCRQASTWQPYLSDHPNFKIGINLSARQFARPGLPERITAMLHHYGVHPGNLLLEITETATTFDIDAAVDQMRALRALGVRLAIDDFGTGFASLTYLRRFPIDVLKIDRSFIQDLPEDAAARTIIRGLTNLAQLLKLSVTAEGIETLDQLYEAVDLGCERGQGYYFGHPVDADEATCLIDKGLPALRPAEPLRLRAAS